MVKQDISGSNLLDALNPEDRLLLGQVMEEVEYRAGHILYEPGDDVRHAYFPRRFAVTSFHVIMPDGSAVETAIVGREGAVGGIVSHGRLPAFARSCVMHHGPFYKISLAELERVKQQSIHLRYLLARYADCLLAQVFQSVACNAVHTIEQRAAKWLLIAMDRTGRNEVSMTQDQLGSLLGVGRTYVSRVIRRLKESGTVSVRRGGVIVHNREGLSAKSCDCEKLVEAHFRTVLHNVYPEKANGR